MGSEAQVGEIMVVALVAASDDRNEAKYDLADVQMVYEAIGQVVLSPLWLSDNLSRDEYIVACEKMIDVADVVVCTGLRAGGLSKRLIAKAKKAGKQVIWYSKNKNVYLRWLKEKTEKIRREEQKWKTKSGTKSTKKKSVQE